MKNSIESIMKSSFDKKYPLFVKYILDPDIQKNMMANTDLLRKYDAYSETISVFLFELEKHFDVVTINKIITDAILKAPDKIMVSIITAYLNSDEVAKSNPNFIAFYNKTSNLGVESVEYIEENGLVTNRNYKDVPNIAIDHKFNDLKTGNEYFKGEKLDSLYETLSYPQRKYVNDLLENKSFSLLDIIFERFNITLKLLITMLMVKGIDANIIKQEVYKKIGANALSIMVYLLIDDMNSDIILNNVKYIIEKRRFDLLKHVIEFDHLIKFTNFTVEEIESLTDTEILKKLNDTNFMLSKKED